MAKGEVIAFPNFAARPRDYHVGDLTVEESRLPISARQTVERYTGGLKCEDCGDQILPSRLRAKPNATRCIDCQLEAERNGWSTKQYKNPRP